MCLQEDLPEDAVDETPAPTQSQSTTEIQSVIPFLPSFPNFSPSSSSLPLIFFLFLPAPSLFLYFLPPPSHPLPSSYPHSGPHCVAVYEFAAGGPDELCLRVGDRVELLARVGNEWLRGRLGGQEGIFPREFIEIREDLPADNRSDVLSKALYDFDGQAGELSFKVGPVPPRAFFLVLSLDCVMPCVDSSCILFRYKNCCPGFCCFVLAHIQSYVHMYVSIRMTQFTC